MRLNTRAFAIASGLVAGVGVFGFTLLALLHSPTDGLPLSALSLLLFGYSVSFIGALIGAAWAFAFGYLGGAVLAFTYNLAMAPPPPPPFTWVADGPPEEGSR